VNEAFSLPAPDGFDDDESPRSWMARLLSGGIIAPVVFMVVMVTIATWFSNAQGVEDIAQRGAAGVRIEGAVSATANLRNRVALAFVVAQAEATGAASTAEVDLLIAQGRAGAAELGARIDRIELDAATRVHLDDFTESAERVLEALSGRDVAAAAAILGGELETSYAVSVDDLTRLREGVLVDIELAQDTAGRVAGAARILVAFFLPFAAVLAYRTSLRRAQRRRRLRDALEHERALVLAKDELIANLSHELRTPLTGIVGFAQTAASDPGLAPNELREMASVIASEADELSRMVDDLITAARDDSDALSIKIDPVDPEAELESVLAAATLADHKVRSEMEPAVVLADQLRLRQILRNLVSNALKHGGPDVAVVGVNDGAWYQIGVSDDGDGVPAHLAERMFERFIHQGDAPITTGSVGLGLSIARRLTELMDGTLQYRREGGRTEFVLRLRRP
jgi:signal transduction histidine kinase